MHFDQDIIRANMLVDKSSEYPEPKALFVSYDKPFPGCAHHSGEKLTHEFVNAARIHRAIVMRERRLDDTARSKAALRHRPQLTREHIPTLPCCLWR